MSTIPFPHPRATVHYRSFSGEQVHYSDMFVLMADMVTAMDRLRELAFKQGQAELAGAIGLLTQDILRLAPDYEAFPPSKKEVERIRQHYGHTEVVS